MRPVLMIVVAAGAFAACFPSSALAQDTHERVSGDERAVSVGLGVPDSLDFHGHIGVALGGAPEYEGSDDFSMVGLPLIDIRQPDFFFLKGASVNPNDGLASIGWSALNFGFAIRSEKKFGISLGPIIRLHRGRDDDDNSALNGLGDIDYSAGLGGFIEARAGGWSAAVTAVLQDVAQKDDGLLVVFQTGYVAKVSEHFSLEPGVSLSWGSGDYMDGFYGVSAAQATRSGLAPFDANAGLKDVGVQIGATYDISEHFLLNGQVGYLRFVGDAADSPIVDDVGSPDQFRVLFGAAYKF